MAAKRPLVITGPQIERLPVGDFVDLGKLNIGPPQLIDVVGPTITVQGSHVHVETAINNITVTTINGGETSDLLLIHGAGTNKINFDLGGNILLPKKRTVQGLTTVLWLIKDGGNWYEISFSG